MVLAQKSTVTEAHREVVRTLIDRLLPARGPHPGALALGIDVETMKAFEATRTGRVWIQVMFRELGGYSFLKMAPAEQDSRITQLLADRAPTSRLYQSMLDRVTTSYFVKPDSWAALGYRTPQPGGYLDYAESDAGVGSCNGG